MSGIAASATIRSTPARVLGVVIAVIAGAGLTWPEVSEASAVTRASITTKVSDESPVAGETVRLTGRVTGRRPGSEVRLRIVDGSDTTRVATATLTSTRRYAMTWTTPSRQHVHTTLQVVAPKVGKRRAVAGPRVSVTTIAPPFDGSSVRSGIFDRINAERARRGMEPMVMVDEYTEVADGLAEEAFTEHGGTLPDDQMWGRFPSEVFDIGMCQGHNVNTADESEFAAKEWDFYEDATILAIGLHEQPDGEGFTVLVYTLGVAASTG